MGGEPGESHLFTQVYPSMQDLYILCHNSEISTSMSMRDVKAGKSLPDHG